jgi:hypothetical protein
MHPYKIPDDDDDDDDDATEHVEPTDDDDDEDGSGRPVPSLHRRPYRDIPDLSTS